MSAIRRALRFAFVSQYTAQAVHFASVLITARLLTPAEIGTYSVAAVVLWLATELRTYGINEYVIREPNLTTEKLRRAIAVVLIMSWGLGALIMFAAPIFASFYGEPGLADVLRVVAVGFVFTPFVSVPYAVLMRTLAFDRILRIQLTGAVTQAVVTVLLAWHGFSYMSFAWGLTLSSVTVCLVTLRYRSADVPLWPSFQHLGEVLSFGAYTGLAGVVTQLSEGVTDLVLGRTGTMRDVGLFSRGLGVVMIFNRLVTLSVRPVVLPHLSDAQRAGRSVAGAYLRAVELHTGLAWPFFAALSAVLLPVVNVLYGNQWDASIPIAEVLVIWALAQATSCYSNDALVAVGRVRTMLLLECFGLALKLTAVILSASHGLLAVAVAVAIAGWVDMVIRAWLVGRAIGFRSLEWSRALWKSGVVGVLVTLCAHVASFAIELLGGEMLLQLLGVAAASALSWFVALRLLDHPIVGELQRFVAPIRLGAQRN